MTFRHILLLVFLSIACTVDVSAQEARRAVSQADMEELLNAGVTPRRLAGLIEERGVNFEITDQIRETLRRAGADERLIQAVEKAGAVFASERRGREEEQGGARPAFAPAAAPSIVGEVKFSGTLPRAKILKVNKDNHTCGNEKQSEDLVVSSSGGIRWAVVSLVEARKPAPMGTQKPVLDQRTCQFQPHVLLVPAGSEVDILNSDGILHNIHTYSNANPAINRAQPKFKRVLTENFKKPETIKVTCDAHGWMLGWIIVTRHPYYAITDEMGSFKIEDVPPGKHAVQVWHETLGKVTKEVEVKPGSATRVVFELK